MDEFVKIRSSEIDMKPGETKAVSPQRWNFIKTIHLICPSEVQVNIPCILLFDEVSQSLPPNNTGLQSATTECPALPNSNC